MASLDQRVRTTSFTVKRCYIEDPFHVQSIQLHMFSDASELAFSAVAYLRIKDGKRDGKISCLLIASKSRVAPLKQLTMPRLELQGAVLSARLCNVNRTLTAN